MFVPQTRLNFSFHLAISCCHFRESEYRSSLLEHNIGQGGGEKKEEKRGKLTRLPHMFSSYSCHVKRSDFHPDLSDKHFIHKATSFVHPRLLAWTPTKSYLSHCRMSFEIDLFRSNSNSISMSSLKSMITSTQNSTYRNPHIRTLGTELAVNAWSNEEGDQNMTKCDDIEILSTGESRLHKPSLSIADLFHRTLCQVDHCT